MKTIMNAIILVVALTSTANSQTTSDQKSITTGELSSSIDIIGPLGFKIGAIVSIEGIAETTGNKIVSKWINVESVNGKKLIAPVRIEYEVYKWANVKSLEDSKRLTLNAYQQIGMRGEPDGVLDQTVSVATGWKYGLYTWLVVVNQTAPKTLADPNRYYESLEGGHPFDRPNEEK